MSIWYLVADIGGTNARFSALKPGQLESELQFFHSVDEHPNFENLLEIIVNEIGQVTGWENPPYKVCFAVACPADADTISFTNSHWSFSQSKIKKFLKCESLIVINDFEAVAHGIMELKDDEVIQIGGGMPLKNRTIGILGAGTGLGVAGLLPYDGGYHIIQSEGGHSDYSPISEAQGEVVRRLRAKFGRVSLERMLSGKGIFNIYLALCEIRASKPTYSSPAQIVDAALSKADSDSVATLDMFCDGIGSAAGNLALTFGAKGGIYLAGGVIPKFLDFFLNSNFRNKFEDKGRFVSYLKSIPVYIIRRENLGLLGASKKLIKVDNND